MAEPDNPNSNLDPEFDPELDPDRDADMPADLDPENPEDPEGPEGEAEPEEISPSEKREPDAFIADPAQLRQAQMNTYNSKVGTEKPAVVKDDNPPNTPKTYKALQNVWMPLILDVIGKTPWTVEDVLTAMKPIIDKFAREYGRHRAAYRQDDAESDGVKGVFQALEKDGGRSPFAYFCASTVKRSIQRGEKGSSIIPTQHRERLYSDRSVTSMDIETDQAQSKSGTIPSDIPAISRTACPACGGKDEKGGIKKGYIRDDETGELIKCPVCKGKGTIIVGGPRTDSDDVGEQVAKRQKAKVYANKLSNMLSRAGLSTRQIEVLLLKFGIEGMYDSSLENTNTVKEHTAISKVLAFADTILYKPYVQKNKEGQDIGTSTPTGIWVEAVKQNKTDLFHEIWARAFKAGSVKWYRLLQDWNNEKAGTSVQLSDELASELIANGVAEVSDSDEDTLTVPKFNPDLPVSLQIAPLLDRYPDIKPLQGEAGKLGSKDALELMVNEMRQAIAPNISIATKSKQFSKQQYDGAMTKLTNLTKIDYRCENCKKRWTGDPESEPQCPNCGSNKVSAVEQDIARTILDIMKLMKSDTEMKECIDWLLELGYQALLEDILTGDATMEDIKRLGYL